MNASTGQEPFSEQGRFSNRFEWDAPANDWSRLLAEKRAAGARLLDLTASNPTRVGLEYDSGGIMAAMAAAESMTYAPDPRGLPAARAAVARYYADAGHAVSPDRIYLTASTSEAYGHLFKLLADPGDEILIPRPGYPLIRHLAAFEGLRAFSYPLRYDDDRGWTTDTEILSALITPRTRAVAIVSPNNPTGSRIKEEELAFIDAICHQRSIALIIDEVFADYPAQASPSKANRAVRTAVNRTRAPAFILNGLSKVSGLPQMKLGWITLGGDAAFQAQAGPRLETLLDFYLSVSTPVQQGAAKLLAGRSLIQDQIQSRISRNHAFLLQAAAATENIRVLRREAGWYAVIDISDAVPDEDRVIQLLAEDNVLIHPGYFYDFHREGFLVASLLTPPKPFQSGITSIMARFGQSKSEHAP